MFRNEPSVQLIQPDGSRHGVGIVDTLRELGGKNGGMILHEEKT